MNEEEEGFLEAERQQIEQIRELDLEELQVEEVDEDNSSDTDGDPIGNVSSSGDLFYDTGLASLHTYLGEVDDTDRRLAFLDGGVTLTIPLFYLEGVVLFPGATLPLRLVQREFIFAIEKVLSKVDSPYTIGVVRVWRGNIYSRLKSATVGTTAEIRQFRRLDDGSINVLARGQQRFRSLRRLIDADGVPHGEVRIIEEDIPLRAPKDAFGKLPPLRNLRGGNFRQERKYDANQSDSETSSIDSFENELSPSDKKLHTRALDSGNEYLMEESSGSERTLQARTECSNTMQFCRIPRGYWPYWVYQMHDSYCLAERVADMWKMVVGTPSMEDLVRNPELLSFSIASKIPASEAIRQELLDIDGISYRLRREIDLLAKFDLIKCKTCKVTIARRSDLLVMSKEGPLNAYVNQYGYTHEVLTLVKANGLALVGRKVAAYSWFPGYAWTIATCAGCETQMGWLFTAIKSKNLKPQSFWGIRSCQVADDMK